jgi:hypothetical protein
VRPFERAPEPVPSHRTTARGILFLLLAAATAACAGTATARVGNRPEPPAGKAAKAAQPAPTSSSTLFPVVGPVRYGDDFGDPRPGGRHEGVDVVAPRRALAVAVEPGTVTFWTTSKAAGCMLYLHGRSGATYLYIHLNNDLGSGNDNRGKCVAGTAYAKGLRSGAEVAAGQPVGYVGDSGDANGVHPHLHFELHPKGKGAVDPYSFLRRARPLLFAARPGTIVSLTLRGTILATPTGRLRLQVASLSASTGLRVTGVARALVLELPVDAAVRAASPLVGAPRLVRGKPVTVTTEPEPVTLAAELGSPAALVVSTVSLTG